MTKRRKLKEPIRRNNYYAENGRTKRTINLSEELQDVIDAIAKQEKMSASWVCETALADYLGITIKLKRLKSNPRQREYLNLIDIK